MTTDNGAMSEAEVVGKRVHRKPERVGDRVTLPDMSPRAYEHPADKAALSALRKVPGFDTMLRKFIGLVGERSLRYLYLASAVRVNERQFTRVNELYEECLKVLDVTSRPELFVAQTPIVNAGAIGVDKPFIVLNSGTVDLFSDDELRLIIGHELGHIMSDHALYKTMLGLLLQISLGRIGIPLVPLALFGVIAALREWDRKSELSADRAGLLCVQDPKLAYTVHMKMAGGSKIKQMQVDEFVAQAEDYEAGGDVLDGVFKVINVLRRRHPFHVTRLAELKRWVDSGGYSTVLSGEYPRRDEDTGTSVYDEVKGGARSYKETYEQSKDPLFKFFQDVQDTGASMWDKARGAISRKG